MFYKHCVLLMNFKILIKLSCECQAEKSVIDIRRTYRNHYDKGVRKETSLTHRDHITVVLQHDFPIQSPLWKAEAVPLIWREVDCHILECQDFL